MAAVAEVLGMALHAHIRGDIVETQQSPGRIDQKAGQGGHGAVQFPLQEVVNENQRCAQVCQRMIDAVLEELRRRVAVKLRHRFQNSAVEPPVDFKDRPVGRLGRVVDFNEFGDRFGV